MGVEIAASILALLVLVVALALGCGAWRWRARTAALVGRLGPSGETASARYDEREIADLPVPFARYFRSVLRPGQMLPREAHLEWEGQFRVGEAADSWKPFVATQVSRVTPPGFVWDARIRMAPGLQVRVRDSYVDGAGAMRGEILGLFPLIDVHDTPEMASAALLRYLAEAPWLPTALLPSQGVQWTAIGEDSARATLADGATMVSLVFYFNEASEVVRAIAAARHREVRGAFEPTPWEGLYGAYAERGGVRVPAGGSVAWLLPGGPFPYWRGRLVRVIYS